MRERVAFRRDIQVVHVRICAARLKTRALVNHRRRLIKSVFSSHLRRQAPLRVSLIGPKLSVDDLVSLAGKLVWFEGAEYQVIGTAPTALATGPIRTRITLRTPLPEPLASGRKKPLTLPAGFRRVTVSEMR
jgi:hypothetical protein